MVSPILNDLRTRATNEINTNFGSVRSAFGSARKETGAAYDQALQGGSALTRQQALQSGGLFPQSALNDRIGQQAFQLNQERAGAMQGLKFQEQQAKMTEFNSLMNTLGGVNQQSLALGGGFGQAQLSGIAGMSSMSPLGGAMGGAAQGASLGMTAAGPWGGLVGGAIGGLGGYLGAG